MASAARTRARRCGGTSRSTAATSRSPRSRRSPTTAVSITPRSTVPSRRWASTPPSPCPGRSEGVLMNAATGLVEVRVPDLGNFKDVAVIEVLVKPGDSVGVDTPLVTLESDKAAMDVPSTASGVIEKIHATKGGTLNSGDLLATLRADGAGAPAAAAPAPAAAAAPPATSPAASAAPAARPAPPPQAAPAPPPAAAPPAERSGGKLVPLSQLGVPTSYRQDLAPIDEPGFSRAHAGPSVRRFARELGVNLAQVAGHGFKDRITHEDVKAFVKIALAAPGAGARPGPAPGPALPSVPAVDYTQFGPTTLEPLTRIQKISGPRLQASWVTIPHVTQFDEADITDLEQVRLGLKDRAQSAGVKLTPLAFIMRACVKTLLEFPRFNSALDA